MQLIHIILALALDLAVGELTTAQAAEKKPNILVIWGDDIGGFNINAYNMGMMGYKTPNSDYRSKGNETGR